MITQEQKDADVMLDKQEEAVFEKWLSDSPFMLDGEWKEWVKDENDFKFYLKNRLRRAFERGSQYGRFGTK